MSIHGNFWTLVVALGALLYVVPARSQQSAMSSSATGSVAPLDVALRVLAWPAKGPFSPRGSAPENRFVFERTEESILAGERLGFLADALTTELGFDAHCREADPLNTLFGSRNRLGVFASMTGWELGFSYASVAAPRWFEHTRLLNPARIAAIVGGGVLIGFRVRTSIRNYQVAQSSQN